jgi:hypothetical protein
MDKIYQDNIDSIVNIDWYLKNPFDIAYLSLVTATEFAESLIHAKEMYPDNGLLQSVALEELWTTNLQYEHYKKEGHHAHFLYDFFITNGLFRFVSEEAELAGRSYLEDIRGYRRSHRAMTIFSRELELPKIFEKIVESHDWDMYGLGFYEHYLREHIRLDSAEGGHGDRVKDLPMLDSVLLRFYSTRYTLYKQGLQQFDSGMPVISKK